ncbi:MAG TPA: hypothetical protein VL576_00315 [Candidatus Paceibacterota bacterium]|nr:hypothetical protein [Candidatus Paceibacterota bacterium]
MPRAYQFTEKHFFAFAAKVIAQGFRRIEPYEFSAELRVANVEPPTPRIGREEGFVFCTMGLEVRVWTSFIIKEGGIRIPDSGWVVIREHGVAKYFAPQMYRTKNFFKRMLDWAIICKEHIQARPVCPSGKAFMSIIRKIHYRTKSVRYYWGCEEGGHDHPKPPTAPWDIGLSPRSLKIVELKRKRRRKYNEKRKLDNKPVFGTARKIRKGWKKKTS